MYYDRKTRKASKDVNHQKFKAKGMKPTLRHYFQSSLKIGCKTNMHTTITCYTMVISIKEGKKFQPFHNSLKNVIIQ